MNFNISYNNIKSINTSKMSSLFQNCQYETSLFLMDKYIQEYYSNNKITIIFVVFGFMCMVLLLKIYVISNILINNINKINSHVDNYLYQLIEKYDINNDNNKIINKKIYDCQNSIENIVIDIDEIKKTIKNSNNDENV